MARKVIIKASRKPVEGATHIMCYDDTSNFIQEACEKLDMTEPEFLDTLIEYAADAWDEFGEIYNDFYLGR